MNHRRSFGRSALVFLLGASLWMASCGGETVTPTDPTDPPPPPANQAPVAAVSGDQVVSAGFAATVEGSGTDADGDAVTLTWSIASAPAGSSAALSTTDTETVSITPDVAGAYTLQLVANDGEDDSAAQTVTITAEDNTASLLVTAAGGGTVTSVDGLFTLEIPAGALAEDTEISMTPLLASQMPEAWEEFDPARTTVYEMQPDGLQFSTPAVASLTMPYDGNPGEEHLVGIPLMISLSGTDAAFLENAEGDLDLDTGDSEWRGDISHFSRVGYGYVAGVPALTGQITNLPTSVQQDTDFPVNVSFGTYGFGVAWDFAQPTIIDLSGPWIAPVGALTGPMVQNAETKRWSLEHPYRCEVDNDQVLSGVYSSEIRTTLDPKSVTLQEGATFDQIFEETVMGIAVTLSQNVLCTAPPPPPPPGWVDLVLASSLESLFIAPVTSMALISALGNVFIHSNTGAPVAPVAVPAAVTGQAVYAAAGAIAANGIGPLVAAGQEGTYVRTAAEAVMQVARAGRALDCFMQDLISSLVWACAGFENREVVFLESTGGGTPTVNTTLTNAFAGVFGTNRPVSVWFGPNGFTESSPMLVATITDDGSDGHLWIATLSGGTVQLTQVPNISWPEMRKVRCAVGLTMCALSAFGNLTGGIGNIFPFKWDGTTATALFGGPFLSIGKIIGVDVQASNGNALIVTADYSGNGFNHVVRVEEWVPAGDSWTFERVAGVVLPPACKNPTVALIRPFVPGLNELLVACSGDGSTTGRIISVTYELQDL
ncbi:MAG: hypothetical protein AAF389_09210 [Gemmatimonadota bacterium]